MSAMLEREIKLRFTSAQEAREAVLALGAAPVRGRRFQDDALFDNEREELRQRPGLRACGESRYNRSVVKAHLAPFNTVDRLGWGFQYLSGLRIGFCRGERI